MNIWFRRSLVVLTVGGGFFGAVISTDTLFAAKNTPVFGYAMIDCQLAINQPNSWGAGVNLFAAAILFALVVHFFSDEDKAPAQGQPVTDSPL